MVFSYNYLLHMQVTLELFAKTRINNTTYITTKGYMTALICTQYKH